MKIDPADLDWRKAHEVMVSAIVPRPICFVSTIGTDGVYNAAPFSFFSGMSLRPTIVGFSTGWKPELTKKDTLVNIEATKEYVINVVTEAMAEAMNQASQDYPRNVDEFKETGLTPVSADLVKAPMIGESPVNMECRLVQVMEFGDENRRNSFIVGEVVRIHVADEIYIPDKHMIDVTKLKPLGRLGGELYCRVSDVFEMKRPEPL
ncbi:flavin reductase family protein [Chloroflexota bacterium]